jgi:hypothetical protein
MQVKAAAEWRSLPVKERLIHALLKGVDEFVTQVACMLTYADVC